MIKKAYFYLKNDNEQEKTLIFITENFTFIAFWSILCFIKFMLPLDDIYNYYMETVLGIMIGASLLFSLVFLGCFILSSFCAGEIIHRVREKVTHNDLMKSEKGWILVDSLVGMVVLSTAVIALLLAFTQATKGTVASMNRTQATYLAQQTLENLKAQDGNSIIKTEDSSVGKYTIVVDTPSVSSIETGTEDLKRYLIPYQVTVSWSDISGGPANKSIKMVGYCYVNP